ncbi:MAG: Eco57I restriction-modification methylase domain-containing protein [Selenomonadaceae bacterium]|nr:Eco57I restriction-modification methylase domain-containing protein [Selenomonadaceae bacterium]
MIRWNEQPLVDVIEILLRDMNSGGNIIFNGAQLTKKLLPSIKPRAQKDDAEKISRTRSVAEVFTPSDLVKFMVDAIDDRQIDSRYIEIACGEAPFVTSRYDAETGENIPPERRAGILDRKLRAAKNFHEAKRAVQSVYGYELQGDSLIIARANVLLSFAEAIKNFSDSDLAEVAEIVAANFFQFDGTSKPDSLFAPTIIDWRGGGKFSFGGFNMKKFDYVISNPPYQDDTPGGNKTFAPPIYHHFMDAARKISDRAVFITPARFLFDAGGTPKDFNRRMLDDPHFKVLDYAPDPRKYFRGVDIKGGVAVTLRDYTKNFGAIGIFIPFEELNSIHQKVCVDDKNFRSLSEIMRGQMTYKLSEKAYEDFPDLPERLPKRTDTALRTNAFEIMPDIFLKDEPSDGHEYFKMLGKLGTERVYRFVRRDYMENIPEFETWKIFVPAANGSGALGEVMSTPLVGSPLVGATQTFISVGAFDTRAEAEACLAYIKSKFCRCMLGILKVTQHNPPQTWAKVPLQDFTADSDIDWSGNVDAQLYRKYNLTATEIDFIERHVKAME